MSEGEHERARARARARASDSASEHMRERVRPPTRDTGTEGQGWSGLIGVAITGDELLNAEHEHERWRASER